jgi:rhodanese-related sulfurtransferase
MDSRPKTFQDMLNPLDKNKTYLVSCEAKGRSRSALDIMIELDFKKAYNVIGGRNQWEAEGLPTVK